ncbi:MAG: hypothetical protein LBL95_07440 [Deltaproteobacteria bacterium]|nr:hypothetical protein [Deltaproteobacteria bacterium]
MSSWLSYLVQELSEGREPVLALAEKRNMARAAVLDERGRLLASDLGNDALERAVSGLATSLGSGQSSSLEVDGLNTVTEKVSKDAFSFWKEALRGRDEAWASWLLTMTSGSGEDITVRRHVLSASGPFTTPRLPDGQAWSLLPLNAGLGRLFVFGDDELALETAALAARAGLKVTLASADSLEMDLRSAQQVGPFELRPLADWSEITGAGLADMGLRAGVVVLVTTPHHSGFLEDLRRHQIGWLGLAGEAADGDDPGLFPNALTPAHKALGLVAAILGHR